MTRAHPHIQAMAPYVLATAAAPEGVPLVPLAQNESLRAPSPRVAEAVAQATTQAALYPDPDWSDLRHALAALHGIGADGILCGAGSLDLIGALTRVYAGPYRAVLIPRHAYPFFRTATALAQARLDTAPEVDATVSVDHLLASVQPDTGLVFVANPGNPTGTVIPKSDLLRLRAGLRDDILLVIDEAYGEFVDETTARCWDMVAGGNVVVLRTFSKAYGLAGFRVGWGYLPDQIVTDLRKVLNPNNLAAPCQAAACAALSDQAYMRATCTMTATLRTTTSKALSAAGFDLVPSVTNFVLLRFPDAATAQAAERALARKGILLRRQAAADLPNALRLTIGAAEATDFAVQALITWSKEARS